MPLVKMREEPTPTYCRRHSWHPEQHEHPAFIIHSWAAGYVNTFPPCGLARTTAERSLGPCRVSGWVCVAEKVHASA